MHACKEGLARLTDDGIEEFAELADGLFTNRRKHYVTQNDAHFRNRQNAILYQYLGNFLNGQIAVLRV